MNFFFQNNPCKHPIVVLKDTSREEAAAMLEFAYTGEVHIDQDLLSGLLHTARLVTEFQALSNCQLFK